MSDNNTAVLAHQVGGQHYKSVRIQPVVYNHANALPFIEGSVVKYITRWRGKNGLEDLEKIKHYVDLLIVLEKMTTQQKLVESHVRQLLDKVRGEALARIETGASEEDDREWVELCDGIAEALPHMILV